MSAKKIIPCLDFKDGKVVKGVHFEGLREMGDPVEMAVLKWPHPIARLVLMNLCFLTFRQQLKSVILLSTWSKRLLKRRQCLLLLVVEY